MGRRGQRGSQTSLDSGSGGKSAAGREWEGMGPMADEGRYTLSHIGNGWAKTANDESERGVCGISDDDKNRSGGEGVLQLLLVPLVFLPVYGKGRERRHLGP